MLKVDNVGFAGRQQLGALLCCTAARCVTVEADEDPLVAFEQFQVLLEVTLRTGCTALDAQDWNQRALRAVADLGGA